MKRVFVEEKAAVATEAKCPNEAAVGAAAAAAVGDTGAALADTDKFLRNEVVGWISSLEAVGSSLPEALDAALARLGKTPEDMVQAFKVKVPWLPCVNFPSSAQVLEKKAPGTFRCCHIDRARTQLMACLWDMPSWYWKQRDLLV